MRVYCHRCKKNVALQQKMGGLICKKCRVILYYHSESMNVIKETKKPKNLEFGKGKNEKDN